VCLGKVRVVEKGSSVDSVRKGHMIWLVRHGESDWNVSGLVQGQAEGPVLTAAGREQAKRLAHSLRRFPIRKIVTSDLTRAVETASIIGQRLRRHWDLVPALRERNFGEAQGTPLSSLHPEWSGVDGGRVVDADAFPPGGESVRELRDRVVDFFSQLAHEERDGDVLVVAHGGVIRVALAHCDRIPVGHMPWSHVPNAGLWSLSPREIRPPVLL
jgi:probable phosphoglycerate mutase